MAINQQHEPSLTHRVSIMDQSGEINKLLTKISALDDQIRKKENELLEEKRKFKTTERTL